MLGNISAENIMKYFFLIFHRKMGSTLHAKTYFWDKQEDLSRLSLFIITLSGLIMQQTNF